jgi:tetrahydromethanopterin S-methyltransferase subunit G
MENFNVVKSEITEIKRRLDAIERAVAVELANTVQDAANMDTTDLTPKVKRKKPEE